MRRRAVGPVVIEARDDGWLRAGLVAAGALAPVLVLLGRTDDLLVPGDRFRAAPGNRP
jgi:hypothetical protein